MSDPAAKARRSRAKDARQQPAPEPGRIPSRKKPKGDRPWHVIAPGLIGGKEWTVYRCATEEQARAMMEKDHRSYLAPHIAPRRIEYRPKS